MLKHQLPPIYQHLLPSDILQQNVLETKATCSSCYQAKPDRRIKHPYKDTLKCCTYYPFMPNYLIGSILHDSSGTWTSSQEYLMQMIQKRQFTIPMGFMATGEYQQKFSTRSEFDFGQREDLLCPYYDKNKNQCTVWKFRGSVCLSFFCVSDFKKPGMKYWEILKEYLGYIEMALAEEVISQLGYSPKEVIDQVELLEIYEFEEEWKLKTTLNEKLYKKFWSDNFEKEKEFYLKSYELVMGLKKKDLQEILGERGHFLQDELIEKYNLLGV